MKTLYIIAFAIISSNFLSAQTNLHLKLVHEYEITGNKILADKLGNFYIIDGEQLAKYSNKGELQSTYSNKRLGKIDDCDVSNPFKLILLYKSSNAVVFLNENLSISSESIDLDKTEYFGIHLISSSEKEGFWIFDTDQQILVHFSNTMNELANSGNLELIVQKKIQPNKIINKGKSVYIIDEEIGILVFDDFANYNKTIPEKNINEFWILKDYYVYRRENNLHFLHKNMLEEFDVSINAQKIESIYLESDMVYIIEEKKIKTFNFEYKQ